MGFISKVELKRQLLAMGVKVEGNYVRKKDIKKVIANRPYTFQFTDDQVDILYACLDYIFSNNLLVKILETRPEWDAEKEMQTWKNIFEHTLKEMRDSAENI